MQDRSLRRNACGLFQGLGRNASGKPAASPRCGALCGAAGVSAGSYGAVLLIACANIANLLMARAAARQKEMAVRAAIGASRGRLLRQMLTESCVLAFAGGALGALFAWWASTALVSFVSGTPSPVLAAGLNLRVLGFTALVSLATGLLFGLAPALSATRAELHYTLKEIARPKEIPAGPVTGCGAGSVDIAAARRRRRIRAKSSKSSQHWTLASKSGTF